MGTDFKDKTKKSFEKCWDNAAVAANTPDLFAQPPQNCATKYEAEPINGFRPQANDELVLRVENGSMIARSGNKPALQISDNPSLRQALAEGAQVAKVIVNSVDCISGVAEVSVE